ncbi:hypothetical protein CLV84_4247 [Neolewinella xylanilytica]|uniref:Uncharacterized protein n=1 Tax=Neolewinella xylanilytica TaxID=1514080 RepID=A0A2S6I004_9BACT|nr:hypothetical protein [Neolewinella xylanilytica]PPK84096.1 hypothetical protein CLV84_4247 [Neolewinella xylanilytica]
MKPMLTLLAVCFTVVLSAQSKDLEDALLRDQMDAGEITLTDYRRQAERLRDAIRQQGGYPEMPTDVEGAFEIETRLSTGMSQSENWKLVRRWLVLAGLNYDESQSYLDQAGGQMLLRVASRYVYPEGGKQLIPTGERWVAAPFQVRWLMEVAVADREIDIIWREPLLEEYLLNSHVIFDGGGVYTFTTATLFDGLLPLVNHDPPSWSERLRQAKLMLETVTTAERSLREYAGAEMK